MYTVYIHTIHVKQKMVCTYICICSYIHTYVICLFVCLFIYLYFYLMYISVCARVCTHTIGLDLRRSSAAGARRPGATTSTATANADEHD